MNLLPQDISDDEVAILIEEFLRLPNDIKEIIEYLPRCPEIEKLLKKQIENHDSHDYQMLIEDLKETLSLKAMQWMLRTKHVPFFKIEKLDEKSVKVSRQGYSIILDSEEILKKKSENSSLDIIQFVIKQIHQEKLFEMSDWCVHVCNEIRNIIRKIGIKDTP